MDEIAAPVSELEFKMEAELESAWHWRPPLPFLGMDKSFSPLCPVHLTGYCLRGPLCPLRHLQVPDPDPRYFRRQTQTGMLTCRHWMRGCPGCFLGDEGCRNLHALAGDSMEVVKWVKERRKKPCFDYDQGFCKYGLQCMFWHRKRGPFK